MQLYSIRHEYIYAGQMFEVASNETVVNIVQAGSSSGTVYQAFIIKLEAVGSDGDIPEVRRRRVKSAAAIELEKRQGIGLS
jgi:hypothetical protein